MDTPIHLDFFQKKKILAERGVTLVELLVVVVLIGILASVTIGMIDPLGQLQKAQDVKRKYDLTLIQRSLETYYQDHGRYPDSSQSYKIMAQSAEGVDEVEWGGSWSVYLVDVPMDPSSQRTYRYFSNGQSYYVYANLERGGADPQACNHGDVCETVASNGGFFCGDSEDACNYGVTSANVRP